jgi:hypothetical protein
LSLSIVVYVAQSKKVLSDLEKSDKNRYCSAKKGIRMRQSPFILIILIISACSSIIPATTPPQLDYTPDEAIVITDETVDTGIFQVDYPDGWRVVKISVTGNPIELVFASPEGEMWIKISEIPIFIAESTPDPNIYERSEIIEIQSWSVYTQGQTLLERSEEFDEIYERVLASIKIL